MHDQSDKSSKDSNNSLNVKNDTRGAINRARARRRAAHLKKAPLEAAPETEPGMKASGQPAGLPESDRGYDPELLYVECSRCGSPVIWEEGRAGRLLLEAGIDPLELDSSCLLLTDGCPACGSSHEYSVRIFRLSDHGATHIVPLHGHA